MHVTQPDPVMELNAPRKDHRDVDLISDALPFGPLWYAGTNAINHAIGYAKFRSQPHDAVIRVKNV